MPTRPVKPCGKTEGKPPSKFKQYSGHGKGLGLILLTISLAAGMPGASYVYGKAFRLDPFPWFPEG